MRPRVVVLAHRHSDSRSVREHECEHDQHSKQASHGDKITSSVWLASLRCGFVQQPIHLPFHHPRGLGVASERGLLMKHFLKMLKNDKGATAIEYGLIAALIAVAAITAMQGLGGTLNKTLTSVATDMNK